MESWLPLDRPGLIIIGDPDRSKTVERALRGVRAHIDRYATMQEARPSLSGSRGGVVLVAPVSDSSLVAAAHELAPGLGGQGPIFSVVPDGYSDETARDMYDVGVSAVFEWPYEALVIPTIITDLLGTAAASRDAEADAVLAQAIRARLRHAELSGHRVSVSVTGGTVALEGEVESYWMKTQIESMLYHVPGVTAVLNGALRIAGPGRSDAELTTTLRQALEAIVGIGADTLTLTVRDAKVILAGTVGSHDDLERLLSMVGSVRGVRGIENLVTVSSIATTRSEGLAARLQSDIDTGWPDADVNVTVFGVAVVLAGCVRTLADKRHIERLVRVTGGIERVVNKLTVAS